MRVRILIPRRKPKKLVARQRSKRSGQMSLIIVLIAFLGSMFALFGDNGLMSVMRMRGRAAQLQYDINETDRQNRTLEDAIRPLRSGDPEAIEKLARERLNMAREGDLIYLLPPETRSDDATRDESGTPTAPALPGR